MNKIILKYKKYIAIFLVLVITNSACLVFFPKKTKAAIPVWDVGINPKEYGIDSVFRAIARQMLRVIIDDIIHWIKYGDAGGPLFIRNWKSFVMRSLSFEMKDILDEMGLGFLCDPFSLDIQISLGFGPTRTFAERAQCTIFDVVNNIQNFYEDFHQGGWRGFIHLTNPQNNFYGIAIMANVEKHNRLLWRKGITLDEAMASAGFLAVKDFTDWGQCDKAGLHECESMCDPGDAECHQTCIKDACRNPKASQIKTPGMTVRDTLEKALGADIDWLISADEIDEVIISLIDALAYRLFNTAGGSFVDLSTPGFDIGYQYGTGPIESVIDVDLVYIKFIKQEITKLKTYVDTSWQTDLTQASLALDIYKVAIDKFKQKRIKESDLRTKQTKAIYELQKALCSTKDNLPELYQALYLLKNRVKEKFDETGQIQTKNSYCLISI